MAPFGGTDSHSGALDGVFQLVGHDCCSVSVAGKFLAIVNISPINSVVCELQFVLCYPLIVGIVSATLRLNFFN